MAPAGLDHCWQALPLSDTTTPSWCYFFSSYCFCTGLLSLSGDHAVESAQEFVAKAGRVPTFSKTCYRGPQQYDWGPEVSRSFYILPFYRLTLGWVPTLYSESFCSLFLKCCCQIMLTGLTPHSLLGDTWWGCCTRSLDIAGCSWVSARSTTWAQAGALIRFPTAKEQGLWEVLVCTCHPHLHPLPIDEQFLSFGRWWVPDPVMPSLNSVWGETWFTGRNN